MMYCTYKLQMFSAHQYRRKRNLYQERIRCSDKYLIGKMIIVESIREMGNSMCESYCNNDNECKFFAVNNQKECRLYASCDDTQVSNAKEDVYEKHENSK